MSGEVFIGDLRVKKGERFPGMRTLQREKKTVKTNGAGFDPALPKLRLTMTRNELI